MKEKLSKVLVLFACCLVIFSYFYLKDIGISQNKDFKKKYQVYNTALKKIKEKKSEIAIELFDDLIEKDESNYLFHRYIGYSYALENDFNQAVYHYEYALGLNPYLVNDQLFMLQFGEITYFSKEYAKTNIIVNNILEKAENEKILNKAKQIQQQIPVE